MLVQYCAKAAVLNQTEEATSGYLFFTATFHISEGIIAGNRRKITYNL
jgi:hypothetical protein